MQQNSAFIKGQIIAFKQQKYSAWVIKNQQMQGEDVPGIRQINKIYQNYQENDNSLQKKETRGRKKAFSDEQRNNITEAVKKNQQLTAKDIFNSSLLNPDQYSYSTVKRTLNELNLVARILPKKPTISYNNQKERLSWGQSMLKWSDKDLRSIVFFDESKLFCSYQGRKFIRVLKGNKILKKYFRLTKSINGGLEIMVWGAISFEVSLKLVRITEKMNSSKYTEMIDQQLVNSGQLNENIFQQDNSMVHASKEAKLFFKEKKVTLLDWPSQSPDMNPIENVWAFVKNQLELQKSNLVTKEDIWQASVKAFFSEECNQLIINMYLNYRKIIQQLIKEKGSYTNY